jgi:hypothetical protein
MPLENMVGNKFISDLNANWPAGTDLPDAGDDHLRGIKNVLQKSFPGITGPVTLTQDQINRGSIPAGSVVPFFQASAPVGWSRTAGITQTFGMRIVPSATVGATSGGTDDPILNDKVPTHTHGFSTTTAGQSADHSHYFSAVSGGMNQNASHGHAVSDPGHSHSDTYGVPSGGSWGLSNVNPYGSTPGGAAVTGIGIAAANTDHGHSVAGSTGGVSQGHTHSLSGTTVGNASAANWAPRYIDMILCTRDAT